MTDDQGDTGFDESVRAAWRAFDERLAARLATLAGDEFVEVSEAENTGRPLLIFTVTGAGRIRCTIGDGALTSFWPPEQATVAHAQQAALTRLGWRTLRSGKLIRDVGKRSIGDLLASAVDALQEVWEVMHPSFLHVHDPFGPEAKRATKPRPKDIVITLKGSPTPGVIPDNADHLLDMVRETLAATSGRNVEIVDRKIRFEDVNRLETKLLISPHAMRLEFCTIVGHGTPDMALLGAVIAEHSSRWPDISIVVTKDHVFAVRALECTTFYPTNLLTAMKAWQEFCACGAIDIIEQLHPEVTGQFGPPHGAIPDGLVDLIRQFTANPGATTPDTIARRTKANTPMLRRYARNCHEWLEYWPDGEPAAGCPDVAQTPPQRHDVQRFMPVLLEAIGVAAELNVAREMGRGR
ncbi:TY-Chap domain-containing protein [Gordonia rhizosphera]|uniref:TY-Chap N-terminal domain-containing protein n=1 Tax=Gordonia rhizosphera NBRC 16068 TaxID=1108045 RepID=K6WDE3_9ACTN|nr:hypothetical protein [Gordonia rhizosphera]GAB91751.1 hypothetical protein GORHZ_145_00060 [Gordonia rhizosphera NBRC 16068]